MAQNEVDGLHYLLAEMKDTSHVEGKNLQNFVISNNFLVGVVTGTLWVKKNYS